MIENLFDRKTIYCHECNKDTIHLFWEDWRSDYPYPVCGKCGHRQEGNMDCIELNSQVNQEKE